VVTNNFVAGGNDGYAILAAAPTVANRTNDGLPQIVGSYLVRAPLLACQSTLFPGLRGPC